MNDPQLQLVGGRDEWLRRVAASERPLTTVPSGITAVLIALGFAETIAGGSLGATDAGRTYLATRGIPSGRRIRERSRRL
jgi:hypothetical protein